MNKYTALWEYVQKDGRQTFLLTFEEIQKIAGIPMDHSFLKYKKELADYGYQVGKISMKNQTVTFHKMTYYFFIDYDNTLFSHRTRSIPESALAALRHLKKAGHKFFIASGRRFQGDMAQILGPGLAPDGYVSSNGAMLEAEGKILKETHLDPSVQNRVMDFVLERGYCLMTQYGNQRYVTNLERLLSRHPAESSSEIPKSGSAFEELRDKPLLSFFLAEDEPAIADLEAHFPELKLLRMGDELGGADVVPKENSKAKGMKQILDYYGSDLQHAVAIGDSMNDVEMIKKAGLGIAMGNAMAEVRDAADYITMDIDEDGLQDAVRYALGRLS